MCSPRACRFKSVLAFYQVWAVRKSVYGFTLPGELSGALAWLEALSFDIGFLFRSWTCVGSLTTRLVFNGLWPLVLMLVVALCLLVHRVLQTGKCAFKGAAQHTLEAAIFISFCVLPSVTRSLFLAFQCEDFGYDDQASPSTRSYLTASLNIECYTTDHGPILATAWVFIILWPVATPLLYAFLLHRCSHAIRDHQPSALSRATRFLWSEFEDAYFWYELFELGLKLTLTNALLFINFDSGGSQKLLRLFIGLLLALFGLAMQLILKPFRRDSDNHISSAVRLMLVLFFVLGIMVKLCKTEGPDAIHKLLDARKSNDTCFTVVGMGTAYTVAVLLLCAGLLVVMVPLSMLIRELAFSQSLPVLHDPQTLRPPVLLLQKGERYHLFLSHIWSTGQDQCAIIKRQLQLLLPGIVVFLDVDDMQNIGDLESYVRVTSVMLFFLSSKYFRSRNCLKEIWASLKYKKPIILVHERQEDKGGGPLEMLQAECTKELRDKIFDGRAPITWHRVSHYQQLTLKLIATEMLRHGPKYKSSSLLSPSNSGALPLTLVMPGEVNLSELVLPKPLVLWCSPGNPGATRIAQELKDALAHGNPAIRIVDRKPET